MFFSVKICVNTSSSTFGTNQTKKFFSTVSSVIGVNKKRTNSVVARLTQPTLRKEVKNEDNVVRTATQRLAYFFRVGNKEGRESHFRKLLAKRAKKANEQAKSVTSSENKTTGQNNERSSNTSLDGGESSISSRLKTFYLTATPFIGLKTRRRRRGNRVIHKIVPILRTRSERKSFRALSSSLRRTGRAVKPFARRLEDELESLYKSALSRENASVKQAVKAAQGRIATSSSQVVSSQTTQQGDSKTALSVGGVASQGATLLEKRDAIHKDALKARPHR